CGGRPPIESSPTCSGVSSERADFGIENGGALRDAATEGNEGNEESEDRCFGVPEEFCRAPRSVSTACASLTGMRRPNTVRAPWLPLRLLLKVAREAERGAGRPPSFFITPTFFLRPVRSNAHP